MTEKEYLYFLIHVTGMGPVSIYKLYEYFKSFREIWMADEKELQKTGILTKARMQALCSSRIREKEWKQEYDELSKRNIRFISFFENEYPPRLLPYGDKPAALFVKGRLPQADKPAVALVGARSCTEYGRGMSRWFASALDREGVQVISGLALGVDRAAHEGALEYGDTFAVLGCGINICYPRENYRLFSDMEVQGGILTEFPPGTWPASMNFPRRNRIISGLADAVVIIEAREKSGSLITADLALEQGKEVFAVPGRISDPLSAGCNRLLQSGAAPCLNPGDILEYLGIKYDKKLIVHKNSEKRLAKKENLVYSCLDSRPRHLEDIMNASRLSVTETMEGLINLELKGLIQGIGNQYYCRKL